MSSEAIASPDLYKQETFQVASVAQVFTARSPLTEQGSGGPNRGLSFKVPQPSLRGEESLESEVCPLPDRALGPREFPPLPASCLLQAFPRACGRMLGPGQVAPVGPRGGGGGHELDAQTRGREDCGVTALAPGFAPLPSDSRRAHPSEWKSVRSNAALRSLYRTEHTNRSDLGSEWHPCKQDGPQF